MNVGLVGMFLLIGIGQACQPIISFNFGAQRFDRVKEILILGLKYGIATGLVVLVVTLFGSKQLASMFTKNDQELINLVSTAMRIYFISPPFMAFNAIVATLFQSTEEPKKATIIALGRGFVFVIIGLLVLPIFFPNNGIWGAILFAEGLTAVYSAQIFIKYLKSHKQKDVTSNKEFIV